MATWASGESSGFVKSGRNRAEVSSAHGVFRSVEPVRVFDGVTRQIRTAILRGQLAPGNRLPGQRELAVQLGVSRQTLREGLRALASEGLVEIRLGHTGGVFVAVPDGQLVGVALASMMHLRHASRWEMQEFRMEFESENAALAALRATEEDLDCLELAAATFEAAVGEGADELTLVELEFDLHEAVTVSTHNGVRVSIMIALSRATCTAAEELAVTFDRDALIRACENFKELTSAIREADADGAAAIMRQHLIWI